MPLTILLCIMYGDPRLAVFDICEVKIPHYGEIDKLLFEMARILEKETNIKNNGGQTVRRAVIGSTWVNRDLNALG